MTAASYYLSAKQATALRKIQRSPLDIEDAQGIVQTTLGSLYRRKWVRIVGDAFVITQAGRDILDRQFHSEIERKDVNRPFAQLIFELADWQPGRRVIRMRRPKAA